MGKASKDIPTLRYGNKIYPEDLAGMLGLPSVGNIWYVDPGKSASGGGTTRADAFITVAEGLAAATADNDDVILIAPSSSTGRTSEVQINWSKRRTHLVGNGPLRKINPRAGISFSSTATSPCLTVSATNCSFVNVSLAQFNDVNVLVNVTAAYNTFNYVHFQGIGNATTGDDAAGRSLVITGADETEVSNSTIGLDTVTRGGAANASLELTGTCARTKFVNCDFPIFTDGAEPTWIKADTGNCYERYLKFENCFFNNPTNASSTALTIGFDLSTTGNGDIFLDSETTWRGATDLANNYDNLYTNHSVVSTANQGLRIINAT